MKLLCLIFASICLFLLVQAEAKAVRSKYAAPQKSSLSRIEQFQQEDQQEFEQIKYQPQQKLEEIKYRPQQKLEIIKYRPQQKLEEIKYRPQQKLEEIKYKPQSSGSLDIFVKEKVPKLDAPQDIRQRFNVLLRTSSGFNEKQGISITSSRSAVN